MYSVEGRYLSRLQSGKSSLTFWVFEVSVELAADTETQHLIIGGVSTFWEVLRVQLVVTACLAESHCKLVG